MGIDYNMSQSIFNMNIGLIYIYRHIEFRIQGNLMVTYQEIQNMFSPAITFKFNTVFQISRATTTLSFYQDCISNLSRAPFITASIHYSVRVSGDAGCHYPSSDHLIPLPSGIFSSCLIGKQTNWSEEKEKKKNSTHKAKTISCQVLPCFNFTDL